MHESYLSQKPLHVLLFLFCLLDGSGEMPNMPHPDMPGQKTKSRSYLCITTQLTNCGKSSAFTNTLIYFSTDKLYVPPLSFELSIIFSCYYFIPSLYSKKQWKNNDRYRHIDFVIN